MSLVLRFVLLLGFLNWFAFGTRVVYNLAHMTNTPAAVEWAVRQGANGIEADLKFDPATGLPTEFYHGVPCDCTCLCLRGCPSDSVCNPLGDSIHGSCTTRVPVSELLSTMARQSQLAVIIIDSKQIAAMDESEMVTAGRAVVDAIRNHLFNNGYSGQVVIGTSYESTLPYLRSAVEAANNTPYANRVFYALDMLDIDDSLRKLHTLPTRNFIYGTGESTCSPRSLNLTTLQLATMNIVEGTFGLTYIWTVDRETTMKQNLPFVTAIMSNYPGRVRDVIRQFGLQLATNQTPIPAATSREIISTYPTCACSYIPDGFLVGGCKITIPAQERFACNCRLRVITTSSGIVRYCMAGTALCMDQGSRYCQHPDTSIQSCRQGGGDCDGYWLPTYAWNW